MTALVVVLACVTGTLTVLVAGLLRSHADILRALHDLGVGERELAGERPVTPLDGAPFRTRPGVPVPRAASGGPAETIAADLLGTTPDGTAARVAVVGTAHSTLLAFLSTGCMTCRDFWDAFRSEVALPGRDTRLVIVTQGADKESPVAVAALAPPHVTTIMSSAAWEDHAVPVAPYFLLVDGPSGSVIGEGAAASWPQVSSLLAQALADTGRNPDGSTTPLSRASGAVREAAADEALLRAGITPGDPALFHEPVHRPPGGVDR